MSVDEKAKELYNKYAVMWHESTADVKECALIAVDEMIEQLIVLEKYWRNDVINPLGYWYDVKEKIKQL